MLGTAPYLTSTSDGGGVPAFLAARRSPFVSAKAVAD